jgi:hypothetical protein
VFNQARHHHLKSEGKPLRIRNVIVRWGSVVAAAATAIVRGDLRQEQPGNAGQNKIKSQHFRLLSYPD